MHHELLDATRRLIAECECENGCPGCVGPVGNTGPLAKAAALRILDLMLAERSWRRSDGCRHASRSPARNRQAGWADHRGVAQRLRRQVRLAPRALAAASLPTPGRRLGGASAARGAAARPLVRRQRVDSPPTQLTAAIGSSDFAGDLRTRSSSAALVGAGAARAPFRLLRPRNDRTERRRRHPRVSRRLRLVRRRWGFVTEQHLLTDYAGERQMLHAVARSSIAPARW